MGRQNCGLQQLVASAFLAATAACGSNKTCQIDQDCPAPQICEQEICQSPAQAGTGPSPAMGLHEGVTDISGRVRFTDAQGEEFRVFVRNGFGAPEEGVMVNFYDTQRQGVRAFSLLKENHLSFLEVFPAGEVSSIAGQEGYYFRRAGAAGRVAEYFLYVYSSDHPRTSANLSRPLTIWEYRQQDDPTRVNAIEQYLEFTRQQTHRFAGCYTKEQLENYQADTMALITFGVGVAGSPTAQGLVSMVSRVYREAIRFGELAGFEQFPEETYDVYEPNNFTGATEFRGVPGRRSCPGKPGGGGTGGGDGGRPPMPDAGMPDNVPDARTPARCDEGYLAPTGLGYQGCWFQSRPGESCNSACASQGMSCVRENWNDDRNCSVCRHFNKVVDECGPHPNEGAPFIEHDDDCRYREGRSQDCGYRHNFIEAPRLCVCE